jgi:hypothetical protein
MDWKELPWDARVWLGIAFGLLVVVAVIVGLLVYWASGWWTTNLLRNRLEAKRRMRRELANNRDQGRQEDQP